jgi:hypothetical protein
VTGYNKKDFMKIVAECNQKDFLKKDAHTAQISGRIKPKKAPK